MYGLLLGAFDRGPVNKRTMITSGGQFDLVCGKPKIGSDISYYIGQTFLSKSRRMWAVRVASDDALYGGVSIGAQFGIPLGFGDGLNKTFSGIVPFSRCHPGTVTLYMDNRKVGYDNSAGLITGNGLSGLVDYETGEVNITFVSPVPNKAVVYARWGLSNQNFAAGVLDPSAYEFDGRKVTQKVAHVGTVYSDRLAPNMLVAPANQVTSSFESTMRLWSGTTLVAFANENGVLIDAGTNLDTNATHSVDYATGHIDFGLSATYTPSAPLVAEFYSQKSEAFIITGDNPGNWTDEYFVSITDIDPIRNSFTISVFERDNRGINVRMDSLQSSRVHQKDGQERQMYIEEKINDKSYYIRTKDNPYLEETEALPSESFAHNSLTSRVLQQLSGGSKGSAPSVGHYITQLQKFNNREDVKADIIIDTLGDMNFQLEIAKLCDRDLGGRGDCYGVLYMPFELESSNNYVDDMVTYRKYDLNLTTSFCGIYAGHVKIYDGYNGREIWIPNVGFVAAAFSYTADQYEPWFPAAGWRRGVLPVLDVYRRFSLGERDVLYDNDINPIRFRPGKGIAIWGQKTLYGRPSALDRANVRWLLIVVENAVEEFLEEYEFELNDSFARALVRSGISDYLTSIKNRRGIYDFDVVCDDTNNSTEQIDEYQMFVDYYLQPTKAAEYIYGRAVITRTGIDFKDVRLQ